MYISAIRVFVWVCFIVYFLQTYFYPSVDYTFSLRYLGHEDFNVIQFITHSLLHGTPLHLLLNLMMLILFGSKIELFFGKDRFLILFFVSVFGGALFHTISNLMIVYNQFGEIFPLLPDLDNPSERVLFTLEYGHTMYSILTGGMIGASGGVFGCMIAYTILFPKEKFSLIILPYEFPARWFILLYIGLEIYNTMTMQNNLIAHYAHLGGAIFGLFYSLYLKLKYKI